MKTYTSIKNIERQSLRETVYQSLKMAIITMELKPGEKIRDQELAKHFNVSRTPVREALRQLENEGLVKSTPSALTRVVELDIKEVKQAFIVAASLHALAAKLAVPKLKENDLQQLKQINSDFSKKLRKGDLIKAMQADDHFHEIFLSVAENKEVTHALERITPKIRRLEMAKFDSIKGIDSVEEHNKIIEACEIGDSKAVSDFMEENWLSLGKMLTKST